ncbi:MAG TPA: type II toxin-antitoxin system VapC family toxin [Longimicrobiales bacterium]|nr:type II toxin-antitoxin system VapC family toxin [Longimicrobiales bacterium]
MRLLLDTHVLIWWDEGARLTAKATDAIRSADQVYVSAASGWEIAIKASLGRLSTDRRVVDAVVESGFEELAVRLVHAEGVQALPWHHRDPFDRLLVSQALADTLTVVTRDRIFDAYGVRVLRA